MFQLQRLLVSLGQGQARQTLQAWAATQELLQIPPLPARTLIRTEPLTLKESERDHILKALEASNWVVGGAFGAAARLGLKRTTLIDRMRRHGLSRDIAQRRFAI